MENILKLFLNLTYFSTLRKASVVMELNCGTHYLNAIDAYNLSLCNCRGSRVVRRDRGSKIVKKFFFSFTTILKASKRGKQLVLLSQLKHFAYGYNLCILKVSLDELKV